nr:nucleotide sugar dehydrogenase [Candidatus Omnitrophota bacterium]
MFNELKAKIESKKANIGIIGQGYVGLPLAVEFAKAGFNVTGFDTDEKKVSGINKGVSHILDVPSGDIKSLIAADKLKATADIKLLNKMDVIIICVPTPLRKTKEPDISYILAASDAIANNKKKGQLIILESTTYPGTTEEIILPKLNGDGLNVGKDFFLAFSPERVDPGNSKYKTKDITKIVGGVTAECTELARLLYSQAIKDVVPVSSTRSAEMVKLLENTFRSVNIAMVNELALMCHKMNLDVWEIINAAKTKPFGFMPFYPGPGIGGHCLSEKEFLLLKDSSGVKLTRIGEIFAELKEVPEIKKMYYKDVLFVFPQELYTLSFDPNTRKLIFKKVHCLTERQYSGASLEIKTVDNRSIKVTDKHPLFVQNGKLTVKLAKDLKLGEEMPIIKELPEDIADLRLSLKKRLKISTHCKTCKDYGAFITSRIKSIDRINLKKVYSLEVEDTNTFVSSFGIISHNCIPLDPLYLSWKARQHGFEARFIELAAEINSYMPHYVVDKIISILNEKGKPLKGSNILIIGITYKKDINDVRESPGLEIVDSLIKKDAHVHCHDPLVSGFELDGGKKITTVKLTKDIISSSDLVVIITDHSDIDYKLIVDSAKLIFDTRNALKDFKTAKNIIKL